jgi:two-component system response regulator MtrA
VTSASNADQITDVIHSDDPTVTMTRILLVEDNEDLAFGLRRTLESEGYEIEVASDGPTGVAAAQRYRPDLVILDLMLPGFDGYKTLRTIREDGLQMPVLILTARGEEADKVYGFRLGADDYVTKPFGLSELLARVSALLRRTRVVEPAANATVMHRFGTVEVNASARVVTKDGKPVSMTPKELDLLLALIQRRGTVVSRVQLLKEVWGHQAEVMTRTVDIHIAELRRKLEDVPNEPTHLITVWKAGYRFDD